MYVIEKGKTLRTKPSPLPLPPPGAAFRKLTVPYYAFWITFLDIKSAAPHQGVLSVLSF